MKRVISLVASSLLAATVIGSPALGQDRPPIREADPLMRKYEEARRAGDKQAAMDYLKQAVASGNADAEARLADVYRGDAPDLAGTMPLDPVMALEMTKDAVAKGSKRALNDLGLAYFVGKGTSRDYPQALSYFSKSYDAGNGKAARYLGLIYQNGYGTAVDTNKALSYYKTGADGGDITSQCLLGTMYETGSGVTRDQDLAAQWYAKSAQRGDIIASGGMVASAHLLETRTDGKRDAKLALEWYQKAAAQGSTQAQAAIAALADGKPSARLSPVELCIGPSHH